MEGTACSGQATRPLWHPLQARRRLGLLENGPGVGRHHRSRAPTCWASCRLGAKKGRQEGTEIRLRVEFTPHKMRPLTLRSAMRYGILLGWGPRTATLYGRLHNDLAFLNTFTCICLIISRNNLLHFRYVNFTLGYFFPLWGGYWRVNLVFHPHNQPLSYAPSSKCWDYRCSSPLSREVHGGLGWTVGLLHTC